MIKAVGSSLFFFFSFVLFSLLKLIFYYTGVGFITLIIILSYCT